MKINFLPVAGTVLTGAFLFSGCVERVVYTRPAYYPPPPRPVVVQPAPAAEVVATPPPLQVESAPPPPGPDYTWTAGYWEWRGAWVWVPGVWLVPPHLHAIWAPGVWVTVGHRHVWHRGYWR